MTINRLTTNIKNKMMKSYQEVDQTIIDLINKFFKEKKESELSCPSKRIRTDKEIVIGKMTHLEKSICLARDEVMDKNSDFHHKLSKFESIAHELNQTVAKALDELLWASIRYRLGIPSSKFNNIGLREDWEIIGSKV